MLKPPETPSQLSRGRTTAGEESHRPAARQKAVQYTGPAGQKPVKKSAAAAQGSAGAPAAPAEGRATSPSTTLMRALWSRSPWPSAISWSYIPFAGGPPQTEACARPEGAPPRRPGHLLQPIATFQTAGQAEHLMERSNPSEPQRDSHHSYCWLRPPSSPHHGCRGRLPTRAVTGRSRPRVSANSSVCRVTETPNMQGCRTRASQCLGAAGSILFF